MKVLILGATGFIGRPVALAFSRAGHIVYGQTRSEASVNGLAQQEIIPVVADPNTEEGAKIWGKVAEQCDVVVDLCPSYGPDAAILRFETVAALSQARPVGCKITYIYCGGSWVHSRGTGGLETWTSETQPHSGQVKLTQWRWAVEEKVLASTDLYASVIRPALLYGHDGSLLQTLFKAAYEAAQKGEEFETFYRPDTRWMLVHADDCADLFLRVGERGPLCKGQVFIACAQQSERMTDVLDAIVRVSGAKGVKARPADLNNPWEYAVTSTTNVKPILGNSVTGWTTKKMGLVDGMDIYYSSFLAHRNKQ